MAFVRKEGHGQLRACQEDHRKEGCHQLHVSFWASWHFPVSRKIKLPKIKLSTQEKYLSSSTWVAITKYHRWECLNNRHLFLTALEMRSTKSRCQQGRLHPEVSLLDLQAATTLLCAHMISFLCTCREREEERARSLVSSLVRPIILSY